MPLYEYLCSSCKHAGTEFRRMNQIVPDSPPEVCPDCTAQSYRRQISLPHTDLKEFQTPIELYSIALDSDEEIRDFMAKAPGVEVCTDQASEMYGIPIARNRHQKLAALKAAGHHEINSERVRT